MYWQSWLLPYNFCWITFVPRPCSLSAGSYKLVPRTSVPGNDIDCKYKDSNGKYQSFCLVCGGVQAVSDSCSANPSCKSFDMETHYCGYLKSAHKPVYTEGFSSYVHTS